jgi:hypothetical protein
MRKPFGAPGDEIANVNTVNEVIGHGRLPPSAKTIAGEEVSMQILNVHFVNSLDSCSLDKRLSYGSLPVK